MPAERRELMDTRRQNWRFVIGRVGNAMLRGDQPDASAQPQIERVMQPMAPNNPDPYETMALRMFLQFAGSTDRATLESPRTIEPLDKYEREELLGRINKSTSILEGFLVTGRVLGFVPDAYSRYCAEHGINPNMADVRTILKHEQSYARTVGHLSDMPNPLNRLWEEHVGLTGSLYKGSRAGLGDQGVLQVAGTDTLPYIDIGLIPRRGAVIEAYQLGLSKGENDPSCAAKDVFLPRLWDTMCDEVCTNPELFAAELGIEPLPARGVQ